MYAGRKCYTLQTFIFDQKVTKYKAIIQFHSKHQAESKNIH